jgi:hypothetical protein
VQERWFVGHHGAVGGGKHENRGLADITLTWMLEEAMSTGVGVDVEKIPDALIPDACCTFTSKLYQVFALGSGFRRAFRGDKDCIHPSVFERVKAVPDYRPRNIEGFLD